MATQDWMGRETRLSLETTEGTLVAPVIHLNGCQLIPDINIESRQGGPSLSLYDTYSQLLAEWTDVDVPEEALSPTDLNYLLALHTQGSVAVTSDGTNGKKRIHTPGDIQTASVDFGDDTENDRCLGVFLSNLRIAGTRRSAVMSASGFGRLMTLNQARESSGIVEVQHVPMDPSKWFVRFADSLAALDTNPNEAEVYEAEINITGMRDKRWTMDPAQTSYKAKVKTKPTIDINVTVANDAVGRGLITTNLRGNVGKFIRLGITGTVIAGATPSVYTVWADAFGFIKNAPKRKEMDHMVGLPFSFHGSRHSTLTVYRIVTITEQAALS